MSINFPTSLDSLSNPTSSDTQSGVDHAAQHANANDAIEALEAKVGANSSAVTTSHDYKLSGVTGSDKAVSKTGTEILTNKTLTAPVLNVGSDATGDIYYRNSGGVLTRLPIGTAGQILDVSGSGIPEWVANPAANDASTTSKGVVEIATQAEVDAGTGTPTTTAQLIPTIGTTRARLVNSYVADSGSSTAYAIAPSPVITAYSAGQEFTFKATNANTTTTPTLNVNSLGAKTIIHTDGTALVVGQISANAIVTCIYDGTSMQLVAGGNRAKVKMGTTTRDMSTASGNQTIAHGLGITPRFIKITTGYGSNGSPSFNSGAVFSSVGLYDGTNTSSVNSYIATGTSQNGSYSSTDSSYIVYFDQNYYSAGGQVAKATVTFDATNITLAWTKVGSANGTLNIMWEAYS